MFARDEYESRGDGVSCAVQCSCIAMALPRKVEHRSIAERENAGQEMPKVDDGTARPATTYRAGPIQQRYDHDGRLHEDGIRCCRGAAEAQKLGQLPEEEIDTKLAACERHAARGRSAIL